MEGPKEETKFCNSEVNLHCADKTTHKCKTDGLSFRYSCDASVHIACVNADLCIQTCCRVLKMSE